MRHAAKLALVLGFLSTPHLLAAQAAPVASATQQEVAAFISTYVQAINSANLAAYADMYAQRPDLIVVNQGEITRGWDNVRADAGDMTAMQGFKVSVGTLDVISLGANLALAVVPVVVTVNPQPGAPPQEQARGVMSLVVQKGGASWKIIHDHTSIATP